MGEQKCLSLELSVAQRGSIKLISKTIRTTQEEHEQINNLTPAHYIISQRIAENMYVFSVYIPIVCPYTTLQSHSDYS